MENKKYSYNDLLKAYHFGQSDCGEFGNIQGLETEFPIQEGDQLLIPKELTIDPVNKQGEKGIVVGIEGNCTLTIEFEDGVRGYYQRYIFD